MTRIDTPEPYLIEQIERLTLEAREVRRRIDHARTPADRRVLNNQLRDLEEQVSVLQARLRE